MSAEIATIAAESFGWEALRPGQEEAVDALVAGRDALVVMPTGHGKSAIYQLAGAARPGTTLVISPLIALQTDQVHSINGGPGTFLAVMVNSSQSGSENAAAWTALEEGAEYLFLSPEQLSDDAVLQRVARAQISLLVVDEAHCDSGWGHDFRPDYLRIRDVASMLGQPPILALTATGASPVRDEIVEVLGMRDPLLLVRGFDRPNIRLDVERYADRDEQHRGVVDHVRALEGTGLVYAGTRRAAEELTAALREAGIESETYHAGLRVAERRRVHERFLDPEDRLVVVATSAFGMGIDRPDVRFVVHAAIPESVEEYYQEIGRAGRDGEAAVAMLHYREEDLSLRSFFHTSKVNRSSVRALLGALRAAGGEGSRSELARRADIPTRRATQLANQLEEAGVVELDHRRVRLIDDRGDRGIIAALTERAERRQRIGQSRLAMMRSYAETRDCRRGFLLGYFGDVLEIDCSGCDICDSGTVREHDDTSNEHPFLVGAAVEHSDWGSGTVMSVDGDHLTAFFDEEGYRQLSIPALEKRHLLTVVELSDGGGLIPEPPHVERKSAS